MLCYHSLMPVLMLGWLFMWGVIWSGYCTAFVSYLKLQCNLTCSPCHAWHMSEELKLCLKVVWGLILIHCTSVWAHWVQWAFQTHLLNVCWYQRLECPNCFGKPHGTCKAPKLCDNSGYSQLCLSTCSCWKWHCYNHSNIFIFNLF